MKRTGFPAHVLQLIEARSSLSCEVMARGCVLTIATIHHRRPRGAGGTRRRETNSAANGLAVCEPCHRRIESHRTWARENGFLVSQYQDPNDVPVMWRSWRLVYLDNLGGMCDEQITRF